MQTDWCIHPTLHPSCTDISGSRGKQILSSDVKAKTELIRLPCSGFQKGPDIVLSKVLPALCSLTLFMRLQKKGSARLTENPLHAQKGEMYWGTLELTVELADDWVFAPQPPRCVALKTTNNK